MGIFSSQKQLEEIKRILSKYLRLPFSGDSIPGAVMESVLAQVRSGRRLGTYDFVDVVSSAEECGWQVKSTKAGTPVTWKRAKLPNSNELIEKSERVNEFGTLAVGI